MKKYIGTKEIMAEPMNECIAVEKGFQHGGDRLREQGIRVESLAIIDSIDGGTIRFRR